VSLSTNAPIVPNFPFSTCSTVPMFLLLFMMKSIISHYVSLQTVSIIAPLLAICLLLFIVSLTFLPVDAYVLHPPIVRLTRLVKVGDLTFLIAAVKLWNEVHVDVTASQSLTSFHRRLKTVLLCNSLPEISWLKTNRYFCKHSTTNINITEQVTHARTHAPHHKSD